MANAAARRARRPALATRRGTRRQQAARSVAAGGRAAARLRPAPDARARAAPFGRLDVVADEVVEVGVARGHSIVPSSSCASRIGRSVSAFSPLEGRRASRRSRSATGRASTRARSRVARGREGFKCAMYLPRSPRGFRADRRPRLPRGLVRGIAGGLGRPPEPVGDRIAGDRVEPRRAPALPRVVVLAGAISRGRPPARRLLRVPGRPAAEQNETARA